MRTTLRDDLHAVGRPGGVAAVAAAVGGLLAIRAPAASAWALVAHVDALGTADEGTVAVLDAAEVTGVAWVAAGLGAVVVAIALLVAIDRPPPAAERLLLLAAVGLVAVTLVVLAARPVPADFAALGNASDLLAGDHELPDGVSIELTVEPTAGPAVLGAAALVVATCTMLATRRG